MKKTADRFSYSLLEAAEIAGCERTTLYRAAYKGALRMKKMGRKTIILRKDLEEWLEALPPASFRASRKSAVA